MSALPASKKQKPALHLNLDSQSTYSSPLSRFTASRGSINDIDTTLTAGQSVASTDTSSPSALDLPSVVAQSPSNHENTASKEPKRIYVVKVCTVRP